MIAVPGNSRLVPWKETRQMQQQVTASISPEVVKKALDLTRSQYKVARKLEHAYTLLAAVWRECGDKVSARLAQEIDGLLIGGIVVDSPEEKSSLPLLERAINELLSGLIDRENGAAADAMAKIVDLEALERRIGMLITPATGGFMPPSGGSPSRLPA
jgi:hypothetical protein